MATVFKRRENRPIPTGAEIITYRGKPYARWTDAKGNAERAPLSATGDKIVWESPFYAIKYFDHNGRRVKVQTRYPDKDAALQYAAQLERDAENRRRGLIDETQERYAAEGRRTLAQHLTDYADDLAAKGRTAKHVRMTRRHIEAIAQACSAERVADLTGAAVQRYLGELRDAGKSLRTCNAYLRSVKSFTRWLWREKRTADDALAGLSEYNQETDRRHVRRELTPEELGFLLRFVEGHTTPRHNLPGPDRAMVYRVALGTGLRAQELRTLTPESFDLDADPPTVAVAAAYSKRRRQDVQPIRPDLAALLRPWIAQQPEGERVFQRLPEGTARMFRIDLAAARAAWIDAAKDDPAERERRERSDFLRYADAAGRVADFHATRHTYISGIVAGGASVKTAQELARHSTPVLTIGRYSHARLHDLTGALEALPDLQAEEPEAQAQRATGTDDRPVSSGTTIGTSRAAKCGEKRPKPTSVRGEEGGDEETREIAVFPGKTGEKQGKKRRGADRIRTDDGGFAIRQQSPKSPRKTHVSEPVGPRLGPIETKTGRSARDLQTIIDAWPDLPEVVRAGILAMVRAASGA